MLTRGSPVGPRPGSSLPDLFEYPLSVTYVDVICDAGYFGDFRKGLILPSARTKRLPGRAGGA